MLGLTYLEWHELVPDEVCPWGKAWFGYLFVCMLLMIAGWEFDQTARAHYWFCLKFLYSQVRRCDFMFWLHYIVARAFSTVVAKRCPQTVLCLGVECRRSLLGHFILCVCLFVLVTGAWNATSLSCASQPMLGQKEGRPHLPHAFVSTYWVPVFTRMVVKISHRSRCAIGGGHQSSAT